jgi:hypothetical protein
MEENKKKKPLNVDRDHVMKTRRDFLAQGVMAGAASLVLPFNAFAQDSCDLSSITALDNPMIPVIILDLAGGSNIAGSNVVVGGMGGQMDGLSEAGNRTLGLLPSESPQLAGQVEDLTGNQTSPQGILFHSRSSVLQGIKNTASMGVRQRTDGILMCAISDDDTGNNPHNPMYWFHGAGARGKLTQLVGTQGGTSGANSQAPASSIDLSLAPLLINQPQDVLNLVGLGNRASNTTNGFAAGRESILLRALDSLSSSRIRSLSRRQMPDAVKDLVLCNLEKTQALLQSFTTAQLNVTEDPIINSARNVAGVPGVFNLADGNQSRAAGVVKMVLDGLAATGTITLGGYDYHTGDRVQGDQRDLEAGQMIGRILEAASRKNTPVVVYVYTDGGVSAGSTVDGANGRLVWAGDSGQRSASLMLAYNPAGKPQMNSTRRQMGAYKSGGSVDAAASPMSNSVTNLAKAVVLNYLALHGMEGDLEKVVGDNPFQLAMNQHLFFRKIA